MQETCNMLEEDGEGKWDGKRAVTRKGSGYVCYIYIYRDEIHTTQLYRDDVKCYEIRISS